MFDVEGSRRGRSCCESEEGRGGPEQRRRWRFSIWITRCSEVGAYVARRVARRRAGTGRGEERQETGRQSDWITRTTVSLDYAYMRSEQGKEEEKGMPIIVVKESKTKRVIAQVVPSKGVQECAVEVARKLVEQLGCNKVITKSDSEPAILARREAVRREASAEIVME